MVAGRQQATTRAGSPTGGVRGPCLPPPLRSPPSGSSPAQCRERPPLHLRCSFRPGGYGPGPSRQARLPGPPACREPVPSRGGATQATRSASAVQCANKPSRNGGKQLEKESCQPRGCKYLYNVSEGCSSRGEAENHSSSPQRLVTSIMVPSGGLRENLSRRSFRCDGAVISFAFSRERLTQPQNTPFLEQQGFMEDWHRKLSAKPGRSQQMQPSETT
ncbi:hypothetical protein MC885_004059 [Smutsia gigantea]|nr:hypothetical protein MC885_004059 [Smutsia gigantea]